MFNKRKTPLPESKAITSIKPDRHDELKKLAMVILKHNLKFEKLKKLKSKSGLPSQEIYTIIGAHLYQRIIYINQCANQIISDKRLVKLKAYSIKKNKKNTAYAKAKSDATTNLIFTVDIIKKLSAEVEAYKVKDIITQLISIRNTLQNAIQTKNANRFFHWGEHTGGKIGMIMKEQLDHLLNQLIYLEKFLKVRETALLKVLTNKEEKCMTTLEIKNKKMEDKFLPKVKDASTQTHDDEPLERKSNLLSV